MCDKGKVINPWKHVVPESSQPVNLVLLQCVKKHDANNSSSGEWEAYHTGLSGLSATGLSADHIQCTEGRLASSGCFYFYKQDYGPISTLLSANRPIFIENNAFLPDGLPGPNAVLLFRFLDTNSSKFFWPNSAKFLG